MLKQYERNAKIGQMNNKSEAMVDLYGRRNDEDWDWLLLKSYLNGDTIGAEKIMRSVRKIIKIFPLLHSWY